MKKGKLNAGRDLSLNLIDIISHNRHDSMNHLQVIYGFATMKKYDRIIPYIQKVTEEYRQETKLSQLGMSDLSEFLLTYNATHSEMKLNIQLTQVVDIPISDAIKDDFRQLLLSIIRYYECFGGDDGTANALNIDIDQDDKGLIIEVTFVTEQEELNQEEPFSLENTILSLGGKIVEKSEGLPSMEWDIHLPFPQSK